MGHARGGGLRRPGAGDRRCWRKVIELTPARGKAHAGAVAPADRGGRVRGGGRGDRAAHRDVSEGDDRARREVELGDALPGPARSAGGRRSRRAVRALDRDGARPGRRSPILARLVEKPGDARARGHGARRRVRRDRATAGARRMAVARACSEGENGRGDAPGALPQARRGRGDEARRGRGRRSRCVLRALHEFPADLELWDRAAELATALRSADGSGRGVPASTSSRAAARGRGKVLDGPSRSSCASARRASTTSSSAIPEGAMPYLERVLSRRPDQPPRVRAAEADPDGGRAVGRARGALRHAPAKGTTDQSERIELLNEVALIAEEIIGDAAKAIGYYERILALDPFYTAALDSLEKLYEREGRLPRPRGAPGAAPEDGDRGRERRDQAVARAASTSTGCSEPEGSLGHLEDVLRIRQNDPEARELVERLLDVGALRLRAARVLGAGVRGAGRDPPARAGPRDPARGRGDRVGAARAAPPGQRAPGRAAAGRRGRVRQPVGAPAARAGRTSRRASGSSRSAGASASTSRSPRCSRRPRTRAGRPPSAAKS